MTKIILTRHGQVEAPVPARVRGRENLPLAEQGRRQAMATARRIAESWNPILIYTSPLDRSIETGRIIAEACGCGSEVLAVLNDLDYGEWQGKNHEEVKQRWPSLVDAWHTNPHLVRFPRGDSLQDLAARVADALRLVLERHRDDAVVLVGHDSVNRVLLMQLLDQPLSTYWKLAQDHCAINEIDVIAGDVRVIRINETHHLLGIDA